MLLAVKYMSDAKRLTSRMTVCISSGVVTAAKTGGATGSSIDVATCEVIIEVVDEATGEAYVVAMAVMPLRIRRASRIMQGELSNGSGRSLKY
jgi:hypothetical protein